MRSKSTAMQCYTLMLCVLTMVVSESPFDSSANSSFLLTPSVALLPFPPSSDIGGNLQSQLTTTNFATGSSVAEPSSTCTRSEYFRSLTSRPTVTSSANGYSASQSSTTTSAKGSSVSQSSTTTSAEGSSASQSSTTTSAKGSSASQSSTTTSAKGSSASQSSTTTSDKGSSASQFTINGLPAPSSALQTCFDAHSPSIPVAADSIAQRFSNSISQSLVSLRSLKNFYDLKLEVSRDLFFNYGNNVLVNAGIHDPSTTAEVVSTAVDSLDELSSLLYFTATTNTLAKFLSCKGILTEDTAPWLSQKFLDLVDSHATAVGVDSADSLVIAVADGFFDLVPSLGVLNSDDYVQLFHLFAKELKESL